VLKRKNKKVKFFFLSNRTKKVETAKALLAWPDGKEKVLGVAPKRKEFGKVTKGLSRLTIMLLIIKPSKKVVIKTMTKPTTPRILLFFVFPKIIKPKQKTIQTTPAYVK